MGKRRRLLAPALGASVFVLACTSAYSSSPSGDDPGTTDGGDAETSDATDARPTSDAGDASDASDAARSAYVTTVLADNPLAYYRLGEAPGAPQALDLLAAAPPGIYGSDVVRGVGGLADTTDTEASFGAGAVGAGASRFVRVAANARLEPTAALSVECWVRARSVPTSSPDSPPILGPPIIAYGDDSVAEAYILELLPDGRPQFFVNIATDAGIGFTAIGPTPLTLGQTYHLVGTYNGTMVRLFVDAAQAAASTASGAVGGYASGNGLGIGSGFTTLRPVFDGVIDEVAVYGAALDATRIFAHHTAGTTH